MSSLFGMRIDSELVLKLDEPESGKGIAERGKDGLFESYLGGI
ncbi:hypothetical protein [Leptospira alexanderi]|nr:hypothetical protein [Leptospira alexanderi]